MLVVKKKMSDLDESILSDKVCKLLGTQRVYKEGLLYKRQRGLHGNQKKLKFQERFCRLTSHSLEYYDPNPKKRVSVCSCTCANVRTQLARAVCKNRA